MINLTDSNFVGNEDANSPMAIIARYSQFGSPVISARLNLST